MCWYQSDYPRTILFYRLILLGPIVTLTRQEERISLDKQYEHTSKIQSMKTMFYMYAESVCNIVEKCREPNPSALFVISNSMSHRQ